MLDAEAQVHAASALVGVAVANRLPQFVISADVGGTSTAFDKMFATGNVFWALSGNVTQTIFDGGTLRHKQHAAEEAFEQAKAQYRNTVILAFQNMADTLYALKNDADAVDAATDAESAAQKTYDLTGNQLDAGAVTQLILLGAEQALLPGEDGARAGEGRPLHRHRRALSGRSVAAGGTNRSRRTARPTVGNARRNPVPTQPPNRRSPTQNDFTFFRGPFRPAWHGRACPVPPCLGRPPSPRVARDRLFTVRRPGRFR